MDNDVLAIISGRSAQFSKGQRAIAKFILESYDKAAFMTAGRLAKTVGVSESTVVRLAAELGFDGYPAMRKALQEMTRGRLTSIQRIEVSRELLADENVLKTVLSSDIEKLQRTLQEIDRKSFDDAVDDIIAAKNIYIVGLRSATALAGFMGYYLGLITDNVRVVNESAFGEVFERILRIGEGDVIIGISYPRYSHRTVKALEHGKKMGARVIALTDAESSPLAKTADIRLYARSDMVSFLDSLVAPLSLINALIVAVGIRGGERTSDTFTNLEKLWSEYEVYEKNSG